MFGSQALEVAVGLVVLLFLLATASSAVVELISRVLSLRAKKLEDALAQLLGVDTSPTTKPTTKPTTVPAASGTVEKGVDSVQEFLLRATGDARASYLSAKAYADTVVQLLDEATENLPKLQAVRNDLARRANADLLKIKTELETRFDATMTAVQDAYKKWATLVLFLVGFALAVALNASIVNVADELWTDSVTRDAVVAAADNIAANGNGSCPGNSVQVAACSVDKVSAASLPLGWSHVEGGWWWPFRVLGWFLTAVLVMLGAPFWYDLLTRLVPLQGQRPNPATQDPGSSTTMVAKGVAAPSLASQTSTQPPGGTDDWWALAMNRG